MPPSESQASADRIRAEQDRIDSLDTKRDRKVDVGNAQETGERTEVYIKKVEAFQDKGKAVRTKIEARKNARSPEWQSLENTLNDAEKRLADLLTDVSATTVNDAQKAKALSDEIDSFLRILDTERSGPTDATLGSALDRLGAKPDERAAVLADAPKHYTHQQIGAVLKRVETLSGLDPSQQTEWFGTAFDRQLVFNQLCRGTLESTPAKVLLTDEVERKVRDASHTTDDKLRTLDEGIQKLRRTEALELRELNKRTVKDTSGAQFFEDVYKTLDGDKIRAEESVDSAVLAVQRAQKAVQKAEEEAMPWRIRSTQLHLLSVKMDIADARIAGHEEEANRLVMKTWEQHGDQLKTLDPALHAQTGPALEALKKNNQLTDFEKQLFGKNFPQALQTAVEQQKKIDPRTDYLDQFEYAKANGKRAFQVEKGAYDSKAGRQLWLLKTANGKTAVNCRIDQDAIELIGKKDDISRTLALVPTIDIKDGMRIDTSMFRLVSIEDGELTVRSAQGIEKPIDNAKEADAKRSEFTLNGKPEIQLTDELRAKYVQQLRERSALQPCTLTYIESERGRRETWNLTDGPTKPSTCIVHQEGAEYMATLTPDAARLVEALPAGCGLLILKKAPAQTFDRKPAVLDAADIGYVKPDGSIVKASDGKPVDAAMQTAYQPYIDTQMGYRRSFTVERDQGNPFQAAYTLRAGGKTYRNIIVTKGALDYIYSNDKPEEGMLTIDPVYLETMRDGMTLGLKDLQFVKGEGNAMTVRPASPDARLAESAARRSSYTAYEKESSVPVTKLQRDSAEQSGDVQRVLDRSPAVLGVRQIASTLQRPLQQLQEMLAAGTQGTKRESFVSFARDQATPLLNLLESSETEKTVADAKAQLAILKQTRTGVANSPEDAKIQEQIDALTGMVEMLEGGKTKEILSTIVRSASFDADTWKDWMIKEGPKILAAIVVAVAVTVLVVATCGAATPLIVLALAATAGGMVGYQLGAEGVYYGHQLFDPDVRSGKKYFRERSLIGQFASTGKMVDPETGLEVPMDFLKDVAQPYLKEFAFGFVVNFCTMGAGNIASKVINKYLMSVSSKAVDEAATLVLARQVAAVKAGYDQLAAAGMENVGKNIVQQSLEKSLGMMTETAKGTAIGVADTAVGMGLERIDGSLGVAYNVLRATKTGNNGMEHGVGKRLHLEQARIDGDTLRIPCEGDKAPLLEGLAKHLQENGYSKAIVEGDTVKVSLPKGGEFTVALEGVRPTGAANGTPGETVKAPDKSGALALAGDAGKDPAKLGQLKEYLKQNDVQSGERVQLAEALLGHPLNEQQRAALEDAHAHGEGSIDAYTSGENVVKGLKLRRGNVYTAEEAALLLDAGLAGAPAPREADLKGGKTLNVAVLPKEGIDVFLGTTALKLVPVAGDPNVPPSHLLIDPANPDQHFKAIRPGETVIVGRDPAVAGRFTFGEGVSGRHLQIASDARGRISLTDLNSTNGTMVRATPKQGSGPEAPLTLADLQQGRTVAIQRSQVDTQGRPVLDPGWTLARVIGDKNGDGQIWCTFKKAGVGEKDATLEVVRKWQDEAVSRQREAGNAPPDPVTPKRPPPLPPKQGASEGSESREVVRRQEVVAIPDTHGDAQALGNSLKAAGYIREAGEGPWELTEKGKNNKIVLTGDLLDRGTQNLPLLDRVLELQAKGAQMDILAGNHDVFMLDALQTENATATVTWIRNGGKQVLNEIGQKYGLSDTDAQIAKARELFLGNGPYASIFKNMKLMVKVDDVLYVHAGIDNAWAKIIQEKGIDGANADFAKMMRDGKLSQMMEGQPLAGPIWIRNFAGKLTPEQAEILKAQGITTIVHGHDADGTSASNGGNQQVSTTVHGIHIINGDVGMSSGYKGKQTGFVSVGKDGTVKANNGDGDKRFGTLPTAQPPR